MRVRGRDPGLSLVLGEFSIFSGENAGGKEELTLLLDLAKPAELRIGLERSSTNYSTVSAVTARKL